MKQVRIETPLEKLHGPARDFAAAVLKEQPYLSLSTLYWFKQTAVRFHVRAGKTGATFYKPCKYGFSVTRVTVNGTREHKGFVERIF